MLGKQYNVGVGILSVVSSLLSSLPSLVCQSYRYFSPVQTCIQFPRVSDKTSATARNSVTARLNAQRRKDMNARLLERCSSQGRGSWEEGIKSSWKANHSHVNQPSDSRSQVDCMTAKPAEQMDPFSIHYYMQFQSHCENWFSQSQDLTPLKTILELLY